MCVCVCVCDCFPLCSFFFFFFVILRSELPHLKTMPWVRKMATTTGLVMVVVFGGGWRGRGGDMGINNRVEKFHHPSDPGVIDIRDQISRLTAAG